MINYIKPTYSDAVQLNAIMYLTYVSADGINFKFPYDSGTTSYIEVDLSEPAFAVTDLMIQAQTDPKISSTDQSFISGILALQKTEDDAIAAGWIVMPNPQI